MERQKRRRNLEVGKLRKVGDEVIENWEMNRNKINKSYG